MSVPNVTVFVKVFEPAKVCVAVVTIPPKFPSAGVNINWVLPLIVAPYALDVPEIGPIELKPALDAVMDALTYSVVAIFVELSLVIGVGAVGAPVNDGDAILAFKAISFVLAVILFVFDVTFAVKDVILEV
jgi:hypothetical protein